MKVYNDITLSGDEVKALHTMCQMARDLKLDGHIEEYSNTDLFGLETKLAEVIHSNNKFNEESTEDAQENDRTS